MAKRYNFRSRIKGIRGGNAVTDTVRYVAGTPFGKKILRKAANAAAKKWPLIPLAVKVGKEMYDNFFRKPANGPFKDAPLFATEIDSVSQGDVTESKFVSKAKTKHSAAFKQSMLMAQRLQFETFNNYLVKGTADNNQVASDMTLYNSSTTAYNVNSSVWPGDSKGYSNTSGIFTAFANMTQGATTSTNRLYFKNCNVITTISNASKAALVMDLYECVARHDVSAGSLTQISSSYTTSPVNYWSVGDSSNSLPSTTTGAITGLISPSILNDQPYTSSLFNCYWKVSAKVQLTLAAGCVHRHISHYHIDEVLDSARTINSTMLAGITRNIMLVARGVPGYDGVSVATIPPEYLVTHELTYYADAVPYNKKLTQYSYTTAVIPITSSTSVPIVGSPTESTLGLPGFDNI